MNWIDLLIFTIVLYTLIDGWRRGLILELFDFVIFVTTITAALIWYRPLADYLVARFSLPILLGKPVAFLGLWLGVDWLLGLSLGLTYRFLPQQIKYVWWNRLLGLAPALAKTGISLGVSLTILMSIPLPSDIEAALQQSRVAQPLIHRSAFATSWFEKWLGGNFDEIFNFSTTPPSDESVDIQSVSADKLREEAADEQLMLSLINSERTKFDLAPLVFDPALQIVARAHSRDMWLRGYFAHTNPDGQDPFDRMAAAGVSYSYAGENLALAPSVEIAHTGLMRSPHHRDNLLEPKYGRLGIGIISAGADGLMVTQNFRD